MSAIAAKPTRNAGLRRLSDFAGDAGTAYARSRNFDFGPGTRSNVSMLSPYVRHRLVLEQEIIQAVLDRHAYNSASKFIQEVFWRAYFKGWLEHRPEVWADYRAMLATLIEKLRCDSSMRNRYETAVAGNTGIGCFDAWTRELVTYGYLHNHARMWFASIWVFTLRLPWQLGADFFYRHLVDGDPAANTLGWRWVCGLHTRGKTYRARTENIAKYTDNRFNPEGQLAESAPPLIEDRIYAAQPLPQPQLLPANGRFGLLVTEADGCPASLLKGRIPAAVLGVMATKARSSLPIGQPACAFAKGAVQDAVARTADEFGVSGELSTSDNWASRLIEWAAANHLDTIVTAYAPVGPVADLLAHARFELAEHGIRLTQLRRPYDSAVWPHAQGGYFKLKEKIPLLLDRLGAANGRAEVTGVAG